MKKSILILFGVVFLSGCFLEQKRVETIKVEKPSTIIASYPSQLRGVYFRDKLHCAEPVPDVGVSTKSKFVEKIEIEGTIEKLDGRDPTVLLAREMLYRICEMGMNYKDEEGTRTKALYREVLKTITDLSTAKKQQSEAQKITSEAQKITSEAQKIKANAAFLKEVNITLKKMKEIGLKIDNTTLNKIILDLKQ